jgi:phosphoglycolate phosphatase
MSNKTRPYEGIEALLAELKDRGIKTAVISNKSDAAVKALCGRFFPGILSIASGASDLFREKPDPGLVLAVIRELGAIKEETVYVGDTEVDIQTARNAGIKSVGVSWGYRTKEILMMQPPDFFILHPHQLLSIL